LLIDLGNFEGLLQIALLFEGPIKEIVDQTSFEKADQKLKTRSDDKEKERKKGGDQTKHPAINTIGTLFDGGPHLA